MGKNSEKIDFKIKVAPYNPRKMDKATKSKLKKSMQEFGNIAGITINSRNGHIFAGAHRWKELEDTYGTLELVHTNDDMYAIHKKNGPYVGYNARVVDWPISKEKSANIVANSSLVQGDFTEDLQEQLQDIKIETPEELMKELGLSDFMLEVPEGDKDLDMDDTKTDLKRRKTIEDLEQDDDDDDVKRPSPVKELIKTMKITLPAEHYDRVEELVIKALAKEPFYDELTFS